MEEKNRENEVLHNIADHISKNMPQPEESPLDLIKGQASQNAFNRMKNTHVVADSKKSNEPELPKAAPEVHPLVIGGHRLPMVGIPTVDMVTIFATILSLESDFNPRIKKWLDEAKFQMKDMDEKVVYPRKKAKRKKRNGKSK